MKLSGRKSGSKQVWPKWIYQAYDPLFRVKARMPRALDSLYERYLDLWYPELQPALDNKE
jgi:hypothetical protein